MIGSREQSAWSQSDFYRYCYYKFLNWLIIDAAIILALVAVIIYLLLTQHEPPYYASTLSGQILKLTPRGP